MTAFDAIFSVGTPFLKDRMAETITYTPFRGAARPISAIVQRHGPQPIKGASSILAPCLVVTVSNSLVDGISSATLNSGVDTITVAEREGAAPKTFPLPPPDSSNAGMLVFRINLR